MAEGLPATADDRTAGKPHSIRLSDPLAYGAAEIDYHAPDTDDRVARLKRRWDSGTEPPPFDESRGYLDSLLAALEIPRESQLLVFSKTALNADLVGPKSPRAVYFNDDSYVAWVPEAATIEISAVDPERGALFYTLEQRIAEVPRLRRSGRCLACHASSSTLDVPGYMVRSFLTDATGRPLSGYSPIHHATELTKRWGGWYVTGQSGELDHLGNRWAVSDARNRHADPLARGSAEASGGRNRDTGRDGIMAEAGAMQDLAKLVDLSRYPDSSSDVVAHLVLEHQLYGQNLLTRLAYEHKLNRRSGVEEKLLRYLLFADEAPLEGRVGEGSEYARWFQKQGPFDAQGRSLRELELTSRLFKYRLSYLIYSQQIEALPREVRERIYRRLWGVLSGESPLPDAPPLPAGERRAIVEIVRATKDDLPACWSDPLASE